MHVAPQPSSPSSHVPHISTPFSSFFYSTQIRTTFAEALETGEAGAPIPDAPPALPRTKRGGGPEAAAAAAATAAALAGLSGA
jgi:hypothetical protein